MVGIFEAHGLRCHIVDQTRIATRQQQSGGYRCGAQRPFALSGYDAVDDREHAAGGLSLQPALPIGVEQCAVQIDDGSPERVVAFPTAIDDAWWSVELRCSGDERVIAGQRKSAQFAVESFEQALRSVELVSAH